MRTKTLAIFDAQTQTLDLSLSNAATIYQKELKAILERIGKDSNVVFHLCQEGIEATFLTPIDLPESVWDDSQKAAASKDIMYA